VDPVDVVIPDTYALPALSTPMPWASSAPTPPMYPAYSSPVPAGLTFATKPSCPPL
jgi:hypothetical protein